MQPDIANNYRSNQIDLVDLYAMHDKEDDDLLLQSRLMSTISSSTLWGFLLELLEKNSHPHLIQWLSKARREFRILHGEEVAKLWGMRKCKPRMNYDKLSRSLRAYYKKGIMCKIRGIKHAYRFLKLPLKFWFTTYTIDDHISVANAYAYNNHHHVTTNKAKQRRSTASYTINNNNHNHCSYQTYHNSVADNNNNNRISLNCYYQYNHVDEQKRKLLEKWRQSPVIFIGGEAQAEPDIKTPDKSNLYDIQFTGARLPIINYYNQLCTENGFGKSKNGLKMRKLMLEMNQKRPSVIVFNSKASTNQRSGNSVHQPIDEELSVEM